MYLPFLRGLLGIPFRFEDYWDRAMSFLDVGLWIRMIFWAIVPRVILEAYVNLINDAFTEVSHFLSRVVKRRCKIIRIGKLIMYTYVKSESTIRFLIFRT